MKKYILSLLLIVAALAACVKDKGATPADTLKSILLGKDTLSMYEGDVVRLNYTVTPANYDLRSLVWHSSDTSVIAVSDSGKIIAKKVGTSTISVNNTANTINVSCVVTVKVNTLKADLIAYYPFNGNAKDSSGKGNDGTTFNTVLTANRFGKANSAYYFDGSSSYISIKDNNLLRLNNTDFTINYWINLDEYITTTGSSVLSKNNGPYQNGWNCSVTGYGSAYTRVGKVGRPFYNVSGGDDPWAVGDKIVPTRTWTMITVQYSLLNQSITFYVNGVLDAVVNNIPTPNPLTNANLQIGKNVYNDPSGLTPPYYVKGAVDDIRIYRRALSSSDILKLYNLTY